MFRASFFRDARGNRPDLICYSGWQAFCTAMGRFANAPPSIPDGAETLDDIKRAQRMVSPAIYNHGDKRSKAAAKSWDWAGVDLDGKPGQAFFTVEELVQHLDYLDTPYIIYSTANHRPEMPRLRAFVPLKRSVMADEFHAFWFALNATFLNRVDEPTKDISRIFATPAKWYGDGTDVFITKLEGDPLDPDAMMAVFPRPPEALILEEKVAAVAASLPQNGGQRADNLTCIDTSPIVPRGAVERAACAPQGKRMFSFLFACAVRARKRGYDVTVHDLEHLGQQLALRIGRKDFSDIRHDANSALKRSLTAYIEEEASRLTHWQPRCW